ncbi:MAG: endonuclease I, partial [Candidatus Krumholzibacteriia bacterium]
WHLADPVDQKEENRNDEVQISQFNRNPFIDHPEWVTCIFGSDLCVPATP